MKNLLIDAMFAQEGGRLVENGQATSAEGWKNSKVCAISPRALMGEENEALTSP